MVVDNTPPPPAETCCVLLPLAAAAEGEEADAGGCAASDVRRASIFTSRWKCNWPRASGQFNSAMSRLGQSRIPP